MTYVVTHFLRHKWPYSHIFLLPFFYKRILWNATCTSGESVPAWQSEQLIYSTEFEGLSVKRCYCSVKYDTESPLTKVGLWFSWLKSLPRKEGKSCVRISVVPNFLDVQELFPPVNCSFRPETQSFPGHPLASV